jgi:hypothetical protein
LEAALVQERHVRRQDGAGDCYGGEDGDGELEEAVRAPGNKGKTRWRQDNKTIPTWSYNSTWLSNVVTMRRWKGVGGTGRRRDDSSTPLFYKQRVIQRLVDQLDDSAGR